MAELRKWAHVVNGVAVNISMWDGESDWEPNESDCDLIDVTDLPAIGLGWVLDRGHWKPPAKPKTWANALQTAWELFQTLPVALRVEYANDLIRLKSLAELKDAEAFFHALEELEGRIPQGYHQIFAEIKIAFNEITE